MTGTRDAIACLGRRTALIADDFVWDVSGVKLSASFDTVGVTGEGIRFNGQASTAEIDRIVDEVSGMDPSVIVGFGGGKTLDTAKGVANSLGCTCGILPATASTDASTSALSVIYSDDGAFECYGFYDHNPDLVLADNAIIAQAPPRFLASGIADALATWIDAQAVARAGWPNIVGGRPAILGTAIAERCEAILFEYALPAYEANRSGVGTPALEAVVEVTTLLSWLGFESGGLPIAHAGHNGFTALRGPIHKLTYGKKVAYGAMTQLLLDRAPTAEVDRYLRLYEALDLPVTLEAAKLAYVSNADIRRVVETALTALESSHNMPYAVTASDVVWAIKPVDGLARARAG